MPAEATGYSARPVQHIENEGKININLVGSSTFTTPDQKRGNVAKVKVSVGYFDGCTLKLTNLNNCN